MRIITWHLRKRKLMKCTPIFNLQKSNPNSTQSCLVVFGESDIRVKGLIKETAVEWKIDTGTTNTFISEEVYLSILPQNRPVLESVRKQFATAD